MNARSMLLAVLLTVSWLRATAQAGDPIRLAPVYPTPETIVERMLELGHLRAGEKMCDLGSGDGRIVIMAARRFHAQAAGIEIDDKLFRFSSALIRKLSLDKSARIIHGDLQKQHYSAYDLITVFLTPQANSLIQPMLERELKKGARVVSQDFEFRNWRPTRMETIEDDNGGKGHTLFLYER